MGDPRGFLKVKQAHGFYRPACERVKDHEPVSVLRAEAQSQEQSSRCMDCGTPFCHSGCPLGNLIPEWNDLVFHGHWEKALTLLSATNNLPEVTGRVCPALCEYSCVLGINDDAVTVRENELGIIEHGFKKALVVARTPKQRTGRKIAVIGSGPAGLACADQLNRAGHSITVFERDDRPGGLLRYGIPDFKLEKRILDRRLGIWKKEGIEFRTGVEVGKTISANALLKTFDAVCLAGGSRQPRDLAIPGRDLQGIYFAMEYLSQANRRVAGEKIAAGGSIDAKDKNVVVIGGGDTGSDCLGTALRQGAACVVQIEVLPKPPVARTPAMPWPRYPLLLKTTTSHEEGGVREWAIRIKEFKGTSGRLEKIICSRLDYSRKDERVSAPPELPGSDFEVKADLAFICAGFLHPRHEGLLTDLGVVFDQRGNVKTGENFMTCVEKVFSAGDMRRGQSLVVWAIAEGRRCAHHIDAYLMGESSLPEV
ncbi:MAG TPA: glutamate synthase subunit beta [Candidatus Omnitrophota bacterium]|nr:glutamate synthase subunit beta [Candidatus Omnitrophota bacterium]HRZ14565.1 glutamate synthase subunit beta [Candidatus Omnitrophota bacterium]